MQPGRTQLQPNNRGPSPPAPWRKRFSTSRASLRTSRASARRARTWPSNLPRRRSRLCSPSSRPKSGQDLQSRAGVGHGSLGQLDPGSTTSTLKNCFSDWQRPDNKVEGKCKPCQKTVIAVDKGPPPTEIKLGESSWRMFCGLQGVSWHTDGDEDDKTAASVDVGSWAQPPPRPTD